MTQPTKETVCRECGGKPTVRSDYCPDCGAEDPWTEQATFDFERDVDLPVVIRYNVYDDHHKLWNAFCEQVFGTRTYPEQIANLPDSLPKMKFVEEDLYFVVTEGERVGPYLTEGEAAREAERRRDRTGGFK